MLIFIFACYKYKHWVLNDIIYLIFRCTRIDRILTDLQDWMWEYFRAVSRHKIDSENIEKKFYNNIKRPQYKKIPNKIKITEECISENTFIWLHASYHMNSYSGWYQFLTYKFTLESVYYCQAPCFHAVCTLKKFNAIWLARDTRKLYSDNDFHYRTTKREFRSFCRIR